MFGVTGRVIVSASLRKSPRPFAAKLGLVRTRAGPADLPAELAVDTRYEPDPDFVDYADA